MRMHMLQGSFATWACLYYKVHPAFWSVGLKENRAEKSWAFGNEELSGLGWHGEQVLCCASCPSTALPMHLNPGLDLICIQVISGRAVQCLVAIVMGTMANPTIGRYITQA